MFGRKKERKIELGADALYVLKGVDKNDVVLVEMPEGAFMDSAERCTELIKSHSWVAGVIIVPHGAKVFNLSLKRAEDCRAISKEGDPPTKVKPGWTSDSTPRSGATSQRGGE